jgi:hypothetical protein
MDVSMKGKGREGGRELEESGETHLGNHHLHRHFHHHRSPDFVDLKGHDPGLAEIRPCDPHLPLATLFPLPRPETASFGSSQPGGGGRGFRDTFATTRERCTK